MSHLLVSRTTSRLVPRLTEDDLQMLILCESDEVLGRCLGALSAGGAGSALNRRKASFSKYNFAPRRGAAASRAQGRGDGRRGVSPTLDRRPQAEREAC
ncbi:hypothetical protein PsYK624_035720 [Phanerochaete sordida]|uniref:Uncharacterized protein n=1 Tax=Phanerochaete sordida TaxID=48140 RepID=A0A9P3LAF9_9APHY|nr:hypothetical protein PsYK624_035720 [Phanerochaete sordida]